MAKALAKNIIERHKKLLAERQPYLTAWQTIGVYVMTKKQNFTGTSAPATFLTGKIFDSTAATSNYLLASMLIGALWPNGEKTFQITAPRNMPKAVAERQHVKAFYEKCTEVVSAAIGNERANFRSVLSEYMLDQGSFGISGIMVLENEDNDPDFPCRFEAVDAKQMCITEGKDGFVNGVFLQKDMTVADVVDEYGLEFCSKETKDKYRKGEFESKIKILRVIEPRREGSKMAYGAADKPIASVHIEYDTQHVLKESGYSEMPAFITRFWKVMEEKYGRSPAWETMPNILELNALREALIIATEKILDPPLLVREDGTTEGGIIDTSARAVNVRHVNGRIDNNAKVVEQLVTIGDIRWAIERCAELKKIIEEDFFKDRLVDLNNETRMTAFETNIRNELRSLSLGAIYTQQQAECFSPVIKRVFNICLDRNLLGVVNGSQEFVQLQSMGIEPLVIPDEVVELGINGRDMYQVVFLSPAARVMRFEEMKGLSEMVQSGAAIAEIAPDAVDVINFDEVLKRVQDLCGAPIAVMRSAEEVEEIRAQRAAQQKQAAEMQKAQMQAEIAKTGAQAMESANRSQLRTA